MKPHYGFLCFAPVEAFVDPQFGLSTGEKVDRMMSALEDSPSVPPPNVSWIPITRAFRSEDYFIVEAQTSSDSAEIRFSLRNPEDGRYHIHRKALRYHEDGVTRKVKPFTAIANDTRFAKIAIFQTKYALVTTSSTPVVERRAWIIGLERFDIAE